MREAKQKAEVSAKRKAKSGPKTDEQIAANKERFQRKKQKRNDFDVYAVNHKLYIAHVFHSGANIRGLRRVLHPSTSRIQNEKIHLNSCLIGFPGTNARKTRWG